MAKKELKTNVMRVLDSKKLAYNHYAYDNSTVNGVEVARLLGQDPDRVFKTLVTRGKSGGFFVFMVPVAEELDLKKAARACGEKAVEMLPQKELLPRTGYVHGGCSPMRGKICSFPPISTKRRRIMTPSSSLPGAWAPRWSCPCLPCNRLCLSPRRILLKHKSAKSPCFASAKQGLFLYLFVKDMFCTRKSLHFFQIIC